MSEHASARYNNAANRAYDAYFSTAIVALMHAGIRPRGIRWEHDFVAAQFSGVLFRQRKSYPAELRDVLYDNMRARHRADYQPASVTETESKHAVQRAARFVTAIETNVSKK